MFKFVILFSTLFAVARGAAPTGGATCTCNDWFISGGSSTCNACSNTASGTYPACAAPASTATSTCNTKICIHGTCNGNTCDCTTSGTGRWTGARCDTCLNASHKYPECVEESTCGSPACDDHGTCTTTSYSECYNNNGEATASSRSSGCHSSETCCGGTCCSSTQTCQTWTSPATFWKTGTLPNSNANPTVCDRNLDNWGSCDLVTPGYVSQYCLPAGKTACGPTVATACDEGYFCSDNNYGVCIKSGREACYAQYRNGTARHSPMTSQTNGVGCLPSQTCCNGDGTSSGGTSIGSYSCCSSDRQNCRDLSEPEDGWTVGDFTPQKCAKVTLTPYTAMRAGWLPAVMALTLLWVHFMVWVSSDPLPFVISGPIAMVFFNAFMHMFGNPMWRYPLLLCMGTWICFFTWNKGQTIKLLGLLFMFLIFIINLGGLSFGALFATHTGNAFPDLGDPTSNGNYVAQEGRQQACARYYGYFEKDPDFDYDWKSSGALTGGGASEREEYHGYCELGWIATLDFFTVLAIAAYLVVLAGAIGNACGVRIGCDLIGCKDRAMCKKQDTIQQSPKKSDAMVNVVVDDKDGKTNM